MKKDVVLQKDETDCAAACIATIARRYGKRIAVKRIRKFAHTDQEGTSGLGITKAAKAFGFDCRGVISKEKQIPDDVKLPFIAHVVTPIGNHYVTVESVRTQFIEIGDPAIGLRKITKEEFNAMWTGVFFLLTPTASFSEIEDSGSDLLRFFKLLEPYKNVWIKVFFASLMLAVLGIASAFYFRFLIDEVLAGGLEKTLTYFSLFFLVAIIFQSLLTLARNQLLNIMGFKIDNALMQSYFSHLLKLPMNFFSNRKTGELISRMYDSATIRDIVSSTSLSVAMDAVMIVFGIIFLFMLGSNLAFVALVPVVIGAIGVLLFAKPYEKKMKERAIAEASKQSCMVELITGIETIKSIASEDIANDKAEFVLVEATRKNIEIASMVNFQNVFQMFVYKCGSLAVYWIGGLAILKGKMSLGQLISFVILSGYFLDPLSRLLTLQPLLQEAKTAAERLSEIFEEAPEIDEENEVEKIVPDKILGAIEVKNVSFSYGARGKTLKDVSLKIHSGSKVAFVGESGSGKSTLAKLLVKLYKPDAGEILLDGKNIEDYDTKVLRKKIGYIQQDSLLFSGSIANNIRESNPSARMSDVFLASSIAAADRFITHLPERFSTIVGERGTSLSGGEKQRIAIARTILKKPQILILDEATSGLDSVTEHDVMKNINGISENQTHVIISHKLATTKDCDEIFVFDKGEIVEHGTHEELLKKEDFYYNLWNMQNKGKNETNCISR
ncbi:peptidase domain-containing ABC transporter [Treponema denticola]|uniref:peptidase domain-containing ABC transporter n=1 Tax=Treponema denticola TaxID=158 RepID=UPI0020A5E33D|nr:peptidase domain-containing ABC transporter [Treponema denticola]UTC83714.1 peptidase domain-containing ABC transporter [Treponema denticola]